MPEVSIIVPVYNVRRYIKMCIDSVIAQSFKDWELLLVNDGSTDGSDKICRQYSRTDQRITVIDKANGGLSSARNAGLDCANGRYVLFLDADDELLPGSVGNLYSAAASTGLKIIVGRVIWSDEKPTVKPDISNDITILPSEGLCADILYQKRDTDNGAWGKLYDLSLFDGLRCYNGWYEDLEMFHRICLKTDKIALIDNFVYFYRQHDNSFLNTWSEGRRDIIKVPENIVREMRDSRPALLKGALHRHFSANFNLMLALFRYNPADTASINNCFRVIKELRFGVMTDSNSRLKNRIGALASYSGLKTVKLLSWLISAYLH